MTTTTTMTIPRHITLPGLLAMLVEHGAEALLSAEGIASHADGLLLGPLTIGAHARDLYGDAGVWAAWDALRADHGDRLAAMMSAHKAEVAVSNDRAVERAQIRGTGSVGGDWLRETGR